MFIIFGKKPHIIVVNVTIPNNVINELSLGNGIERRLTGAAKCLGNDVPGYIMPGK